MEMMYTPSHSSDLVDVVWLRFFFATFDITK